MAKCRVLKCKSKYCSNQITVQIGNRRKTAYYCSDCKTEHEIKVLELQYYHKSLIRDLILYTAKLFNFRSVSHIADYLETHSLYIKFWIKKYFGMTFDEFRQVYHCKTNNCIKLDSINVKNKYYLVNKIKNKDICACLNKSDMIMILPKTDQEKEFINNLITTL